MKPSSPTDPSEQSHSDARMVADLLRAYSEGWFPMAAPSAPGEPGDLAAREVEWVQPRQRAVIPLDERFHVSKSLAQRVRSGRFTITSDRAFEAVIRACAASPRGDSESESGDSTWLAPEIVEAFVLLHKHGHAHSIEAWLPSPSTGSRVLVGGLYGLALGKVFCGESMFHRADLGGTDASKVCLVHLVRHLRTLGFELLDAQLANHHTAQFGMHEIPREQYLRRLKVLAPQHIAWRALDHRAP